MLIARKATTVYCTIWSIIEPCNSLIAACMPGCAPLLRKENRGLPTVIRSMLSKVSLRSGSNGSGHSRRLEGESTSELMIRPQHTSGRAKKATTVDSEERSEQ